MSVMKTQLCVFQQFLHNYWVISHFDLFLYNAMLLLQKYNIKWKSFENLYDFINFFNSSHWDIWLLYRLLNHDLRSMGSSSSRALWYFLSNTSNFILPHSANELSNNWSPWGLNLNGYIPSMWRLNLNTVTGWLIT